MAKKQEPYRPSKEMVLRMLRNAALPFWSQEAKDADEEAEKLKESMLANSKRYQELSKKTERLRTRDSKYHKAFGEEKTKLVQLVTLHGPTPDLVRRIKRFLRLP
jgi:hypothetical protein